MLNIHAANLLVLVSACAAYMGCHRVCTDPSKALGLGLGLGLGLPVEDVPAPEEQAGVVHMRQQLEHRLATSGHGEHPPAIEGRGAVM